MVVKSVFTVISIKCLEISSAKWGTNFSSLGWEKKGGNQNFPKILGGAKPYTIWDIEEALNTIDSENTSFAEYYTAFNEKSKVVLDNHTPELT